jgi:hypothetical protein
MDYIAVMVPEAALADGQAIVAGVEMQLSEAREAIRDDELPGEPLPLPC